MHGTVLLGSELMGLKFSKGKKKAMDSVPPQAAVRKHTHVSFQTGNRGAGRTLLIQKLSSGANQPFATYYPSIGLDFVIKRAATSTGDDASLGVNEKYLLWDYSGRSRFSTFQPSQIRNASIIVLVVDSSDYSFSASPPPLTHTEPARVLLERVARYVLDPDAAHPQLAAGTKQPKVVICATKMDLAVLDTSKDRGYEPAMEKDELMTRTRSVVNSMRRSLCVDQFLPEAEIVPCSATVSAWDDILFTRLNHYFENPRLFSSAEPVEVVEISERGEEERQPVSCKLPILDCSGWLLACTSVDAPSTASHPAPFLEKKMLDAADNQQTEQTTALV
eukprot:ANDGO_07714.mRNA.1 hypothetical protein